MKLWCLDYEQSKFGFKLKNLKYFNLKLGYLNFGI